MRTTRLGSFALLRNTTRSKWHWPPNQPGPDQMMCVAISKRAVDSDWTGTGDSGQLGRTTINDVSPGRWLRNELENIHCHILT